MGLIANQKFEEFKASGRLPSAKGVALQVVQMSQQDDVSPTELAQVIKADPALAGVIIKAANALLGQKLRSVVSVVDAVSMLGFKVSRQLSLSFSLISDNRQGVCKKFDYGQFWSRSLLTAITARQLAQYKGGGDREEIFVLGLLSKVGELALATLYPEDYATVLGRCEAASGRELADIEQATFDFNHNQLTCDMMADWGMPRAFQEVALHHEHPEAAPFSEGGRDWRLLNILHIAACFAEVCLASEQQRRKLVPKLMLLAARQGVESDSLAELADMALKEWIEWGHQFGLPTLTLPPFAELLEVAPLLPEMLGSVPALAESGLYRLRILLVDDDRSVLLLVKTMLVNAGHTVQTARNGIEALKLMETFSPQLIISDWVMPEMDGIEFCRELRRNKAWRNIYMFIVTAQEGTDRLVEAFEAGVDDYLVKPVSSKVLAARLRAGQRVVQLQEELESDREQLRKFADDLATSNLRLQNLALTDALTGLGNRRYANERLEQEWALAQRAHRSLVCMIVDIDHFKSVNDTYGHKVGDDALKLVSATLRQLVRKQDVVSRLGGEEFVLLCPDTTTEQACQHAERLRKSVAALVVQGGGKAFSLTISIGVAGSLESECKSAELLLNLADRRLYAAKSGGRNRVVCHG